MPTPREKSERPRLSRAAQAAATRERIIVATIEMLRTRGYVGTTFMAIAQATSLSLGALQHHFSTKADLMGVVVRRLCAQRLLVYRSALRGVRGARKRFEALIGASAELAFLPETAAYFEIELAGRVDAELAEATARSLEQYRRFIRGLVATMAADEPGFAATEIEELRLLNSAVVRGLAIEILGGADREAAERAFALWSKLFVDRAFSKRQRSPRRPR